MRKPKNLYVDLNNLGAITRFSRLQTPKSRFRKDPYAKDLIFVEMIKAIISQSTKNNCTGVVIANEGKNVWRREIYPNYKIPKEDKEPDIYKDEMRQAIDEVAEFFRDFTSALVLRVEGAEADDIIGTLVRNSVGVESMILSSDRDYEQLLREGVSLYSLTQKEFRSVEDPDYSLFVKCFRGDKSDAVESAFKGIRETRLKKAWEDDLELLNLLEEKRPDGRKVSEVLDLNYQLIDLSASPEHIQNEIMDRAMNTEVGRFSEFKIPRVLREQYRLKSQANLFDHRSRPFEKRPVFNVG